VSRREERAGEVQRGERVGVEVEPLDQVARRCTDDREEWARGGHRIGGWRAGPDARTQSRLRHRSTPTIFRGPRTGGSGCAGAPAEAQASAGRSVRQAPTLTLTQGATA